MKETATKKTNIQFQCDLCALITNIGPLIAYTLFRNDFPYYVCAPCGPLQFSAGGWMWARERPIWILPIYYRPITDIFSVGYRPISRYIARYGDIEEEKGLIESFKLQWYSSDEDPSPFWHLKCLVSDFSGMICARKFKGNQLRTPRVLKRKLDTTDNYCIGVTIIVGK